MRGTGGLDLNAERKKSLRNYLGITVSGFPNLFLLMGPNTGLGHNSMIFMFEAQARCAAEAITQLRAKQLASIDVRPDVEAAFRADLAARGASTCATTTHGHFPSPPVASKPALPTLLELSWRYAGDAHRAVSADGLWRR